MNLQVHELVGHSRKMSDEEVEAGVEAINAFLAHWRGTMKEPVFPKLH